VFPQTRGPGLASGLYYFVLIVAMPCQGISRFRYPAILPSIFLPMILAQTKIRAEWRESPPRGTFIERQPGRGTLDGLPEFRFTCRKRPNKMVCNI
jgi:hypothetical protein